MDGYLIMLNSPVICPQCKVVMPVTTISLQEIADDFPVAPECDCGQCENNMKVQTLVKIAEMAKYLISSPVLDALFKELEGRDDS